MAGAPNKALPHPPNRIREVRLRAELSLSEVARRVALPGQPCAPQDIQRYETGENNVSIHRLERIARALGVRTFELLNEYDPPRDDTEREMLAAFRKLGASARKRAIRMLALLDEDTDRQRA